MNARFSRAAATLLAAASIALATVPSAEAWMITDPQSWFTGPDAAKPLESRIPACDDPAVRSAVATHIASAIPSYYGGLKVASMDEIRQNALTVDDPSPVARRYCASRMTMTANPNEPPVHQVAFYLIEERGSFVGLSWGVDVCLAGRDAWRIYDGSCRTMRPPEAR